MERMKRCSDTGSHFLAPEKLRADHIAKEHNPVGPGIRSEGTIYKGKFFVFKSGVPGNKKLP